MSTVATGAPRRPAGAAGPAPGPGQGATLFEQISHEVNGDVTHGLIVGSAMRTLAEWQRLFVDGGRQVRIRVPYLRQHLAVVPPSEVARLVRVAQQRGHQVDSTHPPTHLRLAFLQAIAPSEPLVAMTPEEAPRGC